MTTRLGLLIAGEIRRKEFEHDVAAELEVFGFIDDAYRMRDQSIIFFY
jgi:hypothetical protein